MQNLSILDVIDNNSRTAMQVDNLIFLIRQVSNTYFTNAEPTAADLDKIIINYAYIQQWFDVFEFYGEKAIEDMKKTSSYLGAVREKI